jgi:transposase
MKHYIGIDVSKRDFHACFNEAGDIIKFYNTRIGIYDFLVYLKQNRFSKGNTLIGLESTGSYHLQLSFLATKAGYTVNIINPLITRRQSQSAVRSVKTDVHDAGLIRLCLIKGAGHPFRDSATSLALKTLVRQRANFSMLRLHTKLRQEEVTLRESYLENEISPVNRELVEFLNEKILFLDRKIRKFNPELQKLLQSIPGVGPQTASTCVAEIGDIARFPDSGKLTAYIGLDSRVYESGTSIHGKGYISKRGSKILRTRFYNAASVAVLHDNIFREYFMKKRSEGKPYRVALCAVMHKMVHTVFAVWTRGTPFVKKLNK